MTRHLSILLCIPAAAALAIGLIDNRRQRLVRVVGISAASLTMILAALLWAGYQPRGAEWQFVERLDWRPTLGASYHVGIDGFSLALIVLTALLGLVGVARGRRAVGRPRQISPCVDSCAGVRALRRVHVARPPAVVRVRGADPRMCSVRRARRRGSFAIPCMDVARNVRGERARPRGRPGALVLTLHTVRCVLVRPSSSSSGGRFHRRGRRGRSCSCVSGSRLLSVWFRAAAGCQA